MPVVDLPSTIMLVPLIKLAAGLTKKATALATSSGLHNRPDGES